MSRTAAGMQQMVGRGKCKQLKNHKTNNTDIIICIHISLVAVDISARDCSSRTFASVFNFSSADTKHQQGRDDAEQHGDDGRISDGTQPDERFDAAQPRRPARVG